MPKQKMLTASAMAALCAMAAFSLQAKAQDAGQGMVAVRDAQTGKMRAPTADELKALRARTPSNAALSAGKPQPQTLSARSGAHGVRLGERTMVYDVVTRGPDGKLSSECLHGEAAAADAVNHAHAHGVPANVQPKEQAHEAR